MVCPDRNHAAQMLICGRIRLAIPEPGYSRGRCASGVWEAVRAATHNLGEADSAIRRDADGRARLTKQL